MFYYLNVQFQGPNDKYNKQKDGRFKHWNRYIIQNCYFVAVQRVGEYYGLNI